MQTGLLLLFLRDWAICCCKIYKNSWPKSKFSLQTNVGAGHGKFCCSYKPGRVAGPVRPKRHRSFAQLSELTANSTFAQDTGYMEAYIHIHRSEVAKVWHSLEFVLALRRPSENCHRTFKFIHWPEKQLKIYENALYIVHPPYLIER